MVFIPDHNRKWGKDSEPTPMIAISLWEFHIKPAWPEHGMAPGHNEYRNLSDYDISVGVSYEK